jgi:hypothetical protein
MTTKQGGIAIIFVGLFIIAKHYNLYLSIGIGLCMYGHYMKEL